VALPVDSIGRVPKPLWAPWRLEYVSTADDLDRCIFCEPEEELLVARSETALVVLNKFPYSSGHLLVAPHRHVGDFGALSDEEALEVHRFAGHGMDALRAEYAPHGFNLGWNNGDTSFMPVLGDVKVLPEHLLETARRLRPHFG